MHYLDTVINILSFLLVWNTTEIKQYLIIFMDEAWNTEIPLNRIMAVS